jgi:putative ABC transport system permease protein
MSAEHLRQDFRHAVRRLLRSPVYALVTVATLGLGIGANTAIFSVVNGVILRPLPYPQPEQLMYLSTRFPAFGFDQFWVSPPEYFEFRELNKSFSAVGAFTTGEANLSASDRPRRVRTANVDDHLLTALGIQPAAGRLFRGSETVVVGPPPGPGAPPLPLPPYTILSYELWQAAFGGRDMIGRTVEVNGLAREVIGIMPPGADVMDNRTEMWFPLGLNPGVRTNRGSHFLYLIGRLKDGVTPQQAQTELAALLGNWGERIGLNTGHRFKSLAPGEDAKTQPGAGHILQMEPMQEELIGSAGRAIWVLQAAVGFVLLIACANLANLLLARAETRHREFAVRTALGAGRWHLVRQFMTEGLLLSIAGGALGLVVARLGVQALVRMYPTTLPRTSELGIDPIVLLFTVAVSLATGLLFGLTPLMHTRASGLLSALKEGGAKGATGGVRGRIRSALVVVEVGLAVMLVIGASLLLRTVWNLTQIDAGFDRSRLVTFTMALPPARYPQPPSRAQLYQRLLGQLRAIPGVQGATAMSGLPPNRPLNANDTEIGNYTAPPEGPYENVDYYQNVMTGYFETMGIPIVQGRSFQPSDATSTGLVAIVNETLVNTFWKNLNPIGQQLRPCCGDRPWFTVVGVAKDVKQGGVDQKTGTEFYFLIDQTANQAQFAAAPGTLNIVLRTTLPAAALRSAIEHAVRQADSSVPIARLQDMNGAFDEAIRRPRLLAHLLGGFAGIALLLAAIGTYGVLSYMVAQRHREIGIRMALGADRGRVLAHVLKQGLVLTTIGIAAGLAGAFALNQVIASLLFGVRPTDPTTLALVVMTIVAVAIAACWLPAWRASRLDPNVVLRSD